MEFRRRDMIDEQEDIEKTILLQEKLERKKNMPELLLDSLEIKGYKCFEHLAIEKLKRVNLIVGKNNVGKTAFLEAVWIYANHGDYKVIDKILFDRNEISDELVKEKLLSSELSKEYRFARRNLFSNRPAVPDKNNEGENSPYFVISAAGGDLEHIEEKILNPTEDEIRNRSKFNEAVYKALGSKTTFCRYFYDHDSNAAQISLLPPVDRNIKNLFINSTGLSTEKLIEFWDMITLTPLEDDVINALQILLPLNRIDFIGYPNGSPNRVPVVRLSTEKERLPLKSFGEGMTRLLGISMALAQCQNGILIIDEIEIGLHYSILPDVWKLIFKTAKELNVQVFATTHSKDCVEAFSDAAEESPEDGMLIRLERQGEEIVAKTIEENRLELAMEHGVEVR